jgi:nitrate/nitrite transporter NarK
MLVLLFARTFGLDSVAAGMIASSCAFMNLMSCPDDSCIPNRSA